MNLGIKLIRIASLYMLAGLILGIVMAASKNFALTSLHSHVLLLGWATMAIAGIIYIVMPRCTESKLAGVHFWGHNTGLPLMMASLWLFHSGYDAAESLIGAGSLIVLVSLGAFAVNLFSARHAWTDPGDMPAFPPAAARTRT